MKAGRWDRFAASILALALFVAAGCDSKDPETPTPPTDAGTPATPEKGGDTSPPAQPADATAGLKISEPTGKGTTYWFGSNPARTNITFSTKTDLGSMSGTTNQVAGWANIDFEGKSGLAHLVVPVVSLNTALAGRDQIMKSDKYLDAEQFPTIEFKAEKAVMEKESSWKIDGKFTLRGVTKDISVMAHVVKIPDEAAQKFKLGKGSWVKAHVAFQVLMSEYGMAIPANYANVADVWNVSIDVFGTTEKPSGSLSMDAPKVIEYVKPDKVTLDDKYGKRYRFGLKPQLSSISVVSKTELETVIIQTVSLGGEVAIDAEKKTGKVHLIVPVASLQSGIEKRDAKLRGPDWLDGEKFPNIEFESSSAAMKDDKTWMIEGEFRIHGQSKKVAAEVTFVDIPATEVRKNRWGLKPGIKFHAEFKLKLSDFGVKIPEVSVGRVSDDLSVSFDAVAIAK